MLCFEYKIPHSIFLGRPWPKPGEPLWLDEDQDKALAYLREKNSVCQMCGTSAEDWAGDEEAFVPVAERCFGCETLEMAREEAPKDAKGVKFNLYPASILDQMDVNLTTGYAGMSPKEEEVFGMGSLL